MKNHLLLEDYENVHKADRDSYRVITIVGARGFSEGYEKADHPHRFLPPVI